MLLKPLTLAAAGLAVATQAFLLPPEVSETDIEIANSLPVKSYVVPDNKSLNLTCPGCPLVLKGKHGPPRIKTSKATHLELAFAVDHELEHDRLFVNGFELYPSSDPLHSTLIATVVPDDVHKKNKVHRKHHRKPHPAQLGFSLQVRPIAQNQDGLQLIALDLQIIEVGTMFVDGVPNVHIQLVKDSNGRLAIGSIEATESMTVASTPMDNQEECTNVLCKWMTIMKDKLAHMKSGKNCGGAAMSSAVEESQPDRHPHHHHGHQSHGGRPDKTDPPRYRHSWRLLFKNIAAHILLPIAIGIFAGVTVSL
jgi:hypothetical protein